MSWLVLLLAWLGLLVVGGALVEFLQWREFAKRCRQREALNRYLDSISERDAWSDK